MNPNTLQDKTESIQKTLRMEKELIQKIEELAKESERYFSSQVRFMLKEYIRIKERN